MHQKPTEMNALELADYFDNDADGSVSDANVAALLRRQHETIVKLREALTELSGMYVVHHNAATRAKKALKATEQLINKGN